MKACLLGLLLLVAAGPVGAQAWPARPIRYIVPFPPGGSTDIISRHLTERLQKSLGQSLVVDNVGGAGGSIGLARLAQSPGDGYTIGLGNSATHTIVPHVLARVPYDAAGDFTPISLLCEYVNVLVVNPALPAHNMAQFLALAKARPGGLSFASAGNGSSNHLTAELLLSRAGLKATHVPYKGNVAALADVAGGSVDWMFSTASEVLAQVRAGKVRAIGVSGRGRDALLPNVPPVSDTLADFEMVGFMGLFGPAKLPPAVVARLNAEVGAILSSPDTVERLSALGMKARSSRPEELAARVRADAALWKSVVLAAGIKSD